jgi:tetratricopeptide (TPR) repeat protein
VALLERSKITSGEGETGALAVYRRACMGMGSIYQKQGKHELAAAEFVKATQYPPNLGVGRSSTTSYARQFVAAARELEAAGQYDAAKALWDRAAREPLKAKTEPSDPWSDNYYWKAVALEHIGQKEEARVLFTRLANLSDAGRMKATEATPPEGAIRFLLAGLGLKALGRPEEARQMLNRALELDPSSELARSELASLPKYR